MAQVNRFDAIDFSKLRSSAWAAYDISSVVDGDFTHRSLTNELLGFYQDPVDMLPAILERVRELPLDMSMSPVAWPGRDYPTQLVSVKNYSPREFDWSELVGVIGVEDDAWWFFRRGNNADMQAFKSALVAAIESGMLIQ